MSLGPLYVLLGEVYVQVLCPLFNGIFCLPGVELRQLFIYFADQTLFQGIIGKSIFLHNWFPFHFVYVFFSCEAFSFDIFPFVYSFLYIPCLGDILVKMLLLQGGHTEGPETCEKMLSVTSNQRDAN